MSRYQASASSLINAPAELVYRILADYRGGHPHILPRPYFLSLDVEQGGTGAGTVIRFEMQAFGKKQAFRAVIQEPEPGRVLVETDLDGGPVTTFTVQPAANGRQAQVTITTEGPARDDLAGLLERFLIRAFLQRVYVQELKQLAALAHDCLQAGEPHAGRPHREPQAPQSP